MKVPGRNKAVKIEITFTLKPSVYVFLDILTWIHLSLSAIKLRTYNAYVRVVIICENEPVFGMTYHPDIDINVLLQTFDIRFVLLHAFPHHHQFVIVPYPLFAAIQLMKSCLQSPQIRPQLIF